MNPKAACGTCGTPLTAGFCPRCLLNAGISPDPDELSTPAERATPYPRFGDYELIEEIGRGGMGIVYRARQVSLDRTVAVKLVPFGGLADKQSALRLRAEAVAAGSLRHPNIVTIHEVALHNEQHFIAMDYVPGPSLAGLLRDGPLPGRQAARLIRQVALAVQHAHERGIIHRDLKPSNILLDSMDDQPRITDFGLAKNLRSETQLTLTGQTLGSPNYIPPEQIRGSEREEVLSFNSEGNNPTEPGIEVPSAHAGPKISFASDVYALGATLYHALTGRPPFIGHDIAAVLHQVVQDEPLPLRRLNPSVAADLETICLKCLEKEPGHRYSTAKEMADELSRFLDDEPIHARPLSRTEKAWRWCRRKPALATLGTIVFVLLLLVVVGAPIAIFRIDRARVEANSARLDAERNLYAADMRLASEALRNGESGQVQELLRAHEPRRGEEDLRGFEWRYLQNAARQTGLVTHQLQGLKASKSISDPRLVLTGGSLYNLKEETDQVLAWDMTTWAPVPLQPQSPRASDRWRWYPNQQAALAIDEQGRRIAVYRWPGFQEVSAISVPGKVLRAAVSKDLAAVAVAFQGTNIHGVLVWEVAANSQRWVFDTYGGNVKHLAFAPDGRVLMAAYDDGAIRLWSITDRKLLPSPERDASNPNEDWLQRPFFGPDSTRLFLNRGRERKTLEVWDWSTGRLSIAYQARLGRLGAFTFTPDGAILATAWSGELIVLLDTKESRLIGAIPVNAGGIHSLAFSPSGRLLVSGSEDRTAKLWDMETQRALATLGGNDDRIRDVAFTPDEKSVLTLTGDGIIKVWDLRAATDRDVLWRSTNTISDFAVSADERTIATLDSQGWIHVRDRLSGAEIRRVQTGGPNANATAFAMSFSPTDHVLAWAGWFSLAVLNYDSGETDLLRLTGRFGFGNPAFSPDGRELFFADGTNIRLLDMATRRARTFAPIGKTVFGLAISPDGALLAAARAGGDLTLWDRASGREITNVPAHPPEAHDVEFSPDGRLFASGGVDGTGKLWDVTPRGLKFRYTLHAHVGSVNLVFSPDGRRVVSISTGDSTLKLWDTKTGLEVGTLYGHRGGIAGLAFSRDGNTLYSAAEDGDVRTWQAPPLDHLEASGAKTAWAIREPQPNSNNR